jgi:hypothetical protein
MTTSVKRKSLTAQQQCMANHVKTTEFTKHTNDTQVNTHTKKEDSKMSAESSRYQGLPI